jgi:hypothetical protein
MTIDELWSLRDFVAKVLQKKIEEDRRSLEAKLKELKNSSAKMPRRKR